MKSKHESIETKRERVLREAAEQMKEFPGRDMGGDDEEEEKHLRKLLESFRARKGKA